MRIFRFTIPIPDYYGEEVFEKHLYFVREFCPTKDEVIEAVKRAREIDATYPEDIGEFGETLSIIQLCEEFPMVVSGSLHMVSRRVRLPKFGDQPISVQIICPMDIYPDCEF